MAQLKSTVVQGALTVTGNVVANKLIKVGGTSDQILMADGSTSNKSDLTALINAAVTIKGTLGTGGTITSLPTASASNLGYGYKVITAGTYNSVAAKIGDMFICYKNGNSYAWMHIPSGDDIEDTWRPVQVNGTQILANGNTTGAINLKAGSNVSISNSSGTVTFAATDTGATSIETTGSGNAVTSGSYDSATRKITLTKGSSFLPLSGGTLTGALGFNSRYLIKPVADFVGGGSSYTGAITITLPASIGNTMVSMWIDVYNYVEHKTFSVHVGGYTYNNSTWANKPSAMVYGADHKVRLGHNGTSFIIYIGELTSSWAYPQITVRDVLLGHNPTYANWYKNWTINFTSDEFKNVTATLTDKAWTTRNLDPSQFSTTDTKVTQSNTTTSSWRKVILSAQNDATAGTAVTTDTNQVYETPKVEVQPSTGSLRAAGTVQMNQLKITSTSMINHIEFARNSWNYIVASGGSSAAFGFVAGGKSASGANSTFAVLGDKVIPGQTNNAIDLGSSDYHFKNFYIKGKIYNGSYNYTLPSATGTLALTSDIPTVPDVSDFVTKSTAQTITGIKTFSHSIFGAIILKRNGSTNASSIIFQNNNGILGSIGMTSTANSGLKRWSADTASVYTVWDSGNDGSGSGLDADLLDGKHASEFALAGDIPNDYLPKTTYEWNKEFAAGSNGAVSLGRYNLYDTQLTFDITTTTSTTISGKLVIAAQNGNILKATIYGDASNTLAGYLTIYQSAVTNSRSWIEVFCNFPGWSKNKVHIYGVALNSATVTRQMASVTFTNDVPSGVTSGDTKWTGTIVNDITSNCAAINHSHDDKYVKYNAAQTLTDAQKTQARANIGAGISNFSGNYNDLTNKPTIPTVNNGTLTIQKNGTNVATFTANQSGNTTANITVPNPTDYYWANIKVSASSSTATTPSVQKIGITGSATATAAAAVTMEYDSSYKALKFVFA